MEYLEFVWWLHVGKSVFWGRKELLFASDSLTGLHEEKARFPSLPQKRFCSCKKEKNLLVNAFERWFSLSRRPGGNWLH